MDRAIRRKLLPLVFSIFCLLCATAYAVEMQEVRIRAGLDLFSSLLAADLGIESKKNSDGSILLLLVYTDDRSKAETLASQLEKVGQIRGIPVRVAVSNDSSLGRFEKQVPAGIFLTQPLATSLDAVLQFGRKHQIIVFSPFEGDVERGVLGGIHISDRLLPYLNMSALESSHVQIKTFFLRVSKRYED